jgi:1,4-alpha-glucan branching enzyme
MSAIAPEKVHFGLGDIPHENGVAFRVWAPFADSVSVVGTFNDWCVEKHVCQKDEQGNWYVDVLGAKPGDEYKYVLFHGDKQLDRIDPRARQVTNSIGNAVISDRNFDWENDHFQMPAWNELVIYEMHIGTFNAKDGIGTLETAIEQLPYLRDLGINAVELMPLAEFAGDYSWGYNPAHPYAVETAYGGPQGLKKFVREAHKLGIAVIIDVVYNHFGPSDLNLWQFDGWSENDKGGIYFYNDARSTTPWGDTRPDYGRSEVRQYIFDNAMMWLEEYHADGLRYDMTLYMRSVDGNEENALADGFSLAQWINVEIQQRFPGKITIAEDLRNNASMTQTAEWGGANFGAQWDAKFVHPIRRAIIEIDDKNRSMHEVRDAIYHKYNLDAFERVIYTESHDEVANGKQRVVSEIDSNEKPGRYAIKRSTLGAALVCTAPGIPMLLQAQEFLRDKWFDDSRPIDWSRSEEYRGIVALYADLISLRLNRQGMTAGLAGQNVDVYHLNDDAKLIAFKRWKEGGAGDEVVVVMHFAEGEVSDYRLGFPRAGTWKLRFNSDSQLYSEVLDQRPAFDVQAEAEGTDGQSHSALVNIAAYSCLIYSQDK